MLKRFSRNPRAECVYLAGTMTGWRLALLIIIVIIALHVVALIINIIIFIKYWFQLSTSSSGQMSDDEQTCRGESLGAHLGGVHPHLPAAAHHHHHHHHHRHHHNIVWKLWGRRGHGVVFNMLKHTRSPRAPTTTSSWWTGSGPRRRQSQPSPTTSATFGMWFRLWTSSYLS